MSENRNTLELAADILIAAIQKGAPSISGADAAVAYFRTIYRGLCDAEEERIVERHSVGIAQAPDAARERQERLPQDPE